DGLLHLRLGAGLAVLPVAWEVVARRAVARVTLGSGCGDYVVVGDSAAALGLARPPELWGEPLEMGWPRSRLLAADAGVPGSAWSEVVVTTPGPGSAALARAAYAWGDEAP